MLALRFTFGVEPAAAQSAVTAHPPNALFEKTIRRGGNSGEEFEEAPHAGALLTGFVVHLGGKEGKPKIVGLQGIYLGPQGRQLGALHGASSAKPAILEAKPGYAVGGIGLKAGSEILGLQIFFMRMAPSVSELNPADFYLSDWVGSPSENVTYLANDGRLVLGFSGFAEKELTALALIQASPASLDPPPVRILATDDVTNYQKSWEEPGNKGTGFGPWIFACTDAARTKAGFGLGDSTTNGGDPPTGGIDIAGRSWEMHADLGEEATAIRTFASGPLAPGQQFYVELDMGGVETDGLVGFALQNAAGTDRFEFLHIGGKHYYFCRCNGAELVTPISFHKSGYRLIYTQLANNHFLFDIRGGGGEFTVFPGVIAASDISRVKLYCRASGAPPKNSVYWNRMKITQPK